MTIPARRPSAADRGQCARRATLAEAPAGGPRTHSPRHLPPASGLASDDRTHPLSAISRGREATLISLSIRFVAGDWRFGPRACGCLATCALAPFRARKQHATAMVLVSWPTVARVADDRAEVLAGACDLRLERGRLPPSGPISAAQTHTDNANMMPMNDAAKLSTRGSSCRIFKPLSQQAGARWAGSRSSATEPGRMAHG